MINKAHIPDTPSENGKGGLFYYPEEVTAAYEAAEYKLHNLIHSGRLILPNTALDGSLGTFTQRDIYVKHLAREVADAVIRSIPDWTVPQGDITDIPGVKVEQVDISTEFDWAHKNGLSN